MLVAAASTRGKGGSAVRGSIACRGFVTAPMLRENHFFFHLLRNAHSRTLAFVGTRVIRWSTSHQSQEAHHARKQARFTPRPRQP